MAQTYHPVDESFESDSVSAKALAALRVGLFYVLVFLQPVVHMVFGRIWPITFMLAGFAWYAFPERAQVWHGLLAVSVVGFLMVVLYERLLVKLAPDE